MRVVPTVPIAGRGTEHGRPTGGGALLQLATDALGDIAHRVDRTDHLLLADNKETQPPPRYNEGTRHSGNAARQPRLMG